MDGDGLRSGEGYDGVASMRGCWSVISAGWASHLGNTWLGERGCRWGPVLPETTQLETMSDGPERVFETWTVYSVHVSSSFQVHH